MINFNEKSFCPILFGRDNDYINMYITNAECIRVCHVVNRPY
jgi:hypothetical protein